MIGAFCSSLFYIIRNCVLCYFFKTLYFLIGNFSFRKIPQYLIAYHGLWEAKTSGGENQTGRCRVLPSLIGVTMVMPSSVSTKVTVRINEAQLKSTYKSMRRQI